MSIADFFLFVSHVSEDRPAAMEIVEELERRGIKCWIAPRDVRPGQPFDDEIADAIERSRAMLLVFSDLCNESEYIRREVTVAGESQKVIIPFRIEDAHPRRGLRVRLSDLHWIDGFAARERAIDELATHLAAPQATRQRERPERRSREVENALPPPPQVTRPPAKAGRNFNAISLGLGITAMVALAAVGLTLSGTSRLPTTTQRPATAPMVPTPQPAPAVQAAIPITPAQPGEKDGASESGFTGSLTVANYSDFVHLIEANNGKVVNLTMHIQSYGYPGISVAWMAVSGSDGLGLYQKYQPKLLILFRNGYRLSSQEYLVDGVFLVRSRDGPPGESRYFLEHVR